MDRVIILMLVLLSVSVVIGQGGESHFTIRTSL